MVKPTPTLPSTGLSIELLIPMTWPCELTSGPPEFPGLIAASVWIRLAPEAAATWPCELTSGPPEFPGLIAASVWIRLAPEAAAVGPMFDTIPSVNDPDNPNGEPMA